MLYVLQYDEAYMWHMQARYIAPMVLALCVNTHGVVHPTSCIYMQYRDSVSMLECMVASQRNRLHKLVYIYMEVGHGVCGYNTYIMSHTCTWMCVVFVLHSSPAHVWRSCPCMVGGARVSF